MRRAKLSDVCGWVKQSWDNISEEVIIQSFKKCRISNELGNEDFDSLSELENEDIDEIIQDSDKENEEEFEIEMRDPQARYFTIIYSNLLS